MPLENVDQVLAQIPKTRKKRPAKVKEDIVVVCGSTKWTDRKKMKAALSKLDYRKVKYLITGTSKGAELLAVSVAKELKLPVLQVHPQQHLGGMSAIHIRNNGVFAFFKPTIVYAFHGDIASSQCSAMYLKLGKRKGIPCHLIDRRTKKVSK